MEALQEQIGALQTALAALTSRLDQIEGAARPADPPAASPLPKPVAAPAPVIEEGISEEILIVLSAAVAAFLGKRARIRQVRPAPQAGASAWAQQGRVFIQASHLPRH
jgi:methylmalonyl-CoA carboxyltransferase large subunit